MINDWREGKGGKGGGEEEKGKKEGREGKRGTGVRKGRKEGGTGVSDGGILVRLGWAMR